MQLHVTDLDGYLWYQKLESMTAEDLRDRVLRKSPPNDRMKMGTAWHAILENPPEEEIKEIEKDGYKFFIDCEAVIYMPQVVEVRANKTYHVAGHDVTLTGKVDGITGNMIYDHKLTFRPDVENYFDSYQWRAYLDIFNAEYFTYYIYSAKEKNNLVTITDISQFTVYRYPGMVADLENGISNMVQFIKTQIPEMLS